MDQEGTIPPGKRARHGAGARQGGASLPVRALGVLGRVGAASMVGTFLVVPLAFSFLPVPAGADAVTLCFPGLGPLQQFAGDLSEEMTELVVVHERVHADQCREFGARAWAARYRTVRGRIELEAEAFCAEIDLLAGRGFDPEALLWPRVEALHAGYRNEGTLSLAEVTGIMRRSCVPPNHPVELPPEP